ncbi:MAG: UDP-glucose 4-epimerase GalE [Nocardiopsaceae bacterium]|jgi:UDP-glucose 4-epimerase|nr:UDP-glucose 4-epimerase GalE [Nocardiopsaceae bacterium]
MSILVTGGAGFIGSHTCAELLDHGYDVVVADDFSNSHPASLTAVRSLTRTDLAVHPVDLRDAVALDEVFASHDISAVIHFAAKKAVGESMTIPIDYFDVNVTGTISLLKTMMAHNVHGLVFSSSCSIYGDRYTRPICEADQPGPVNPYARSKLICEQILESASATHHDLSIISLRYFNPAGAHPSGLLGESPRGLPSNIVPYMTRVAAARLERLNVFGADYDTPDGSAIRDYIHVMDVAEAHRIAIEQLDGGQGMRAFNLGTGTGSSVLELIGAFEETCNVQVPYVITGRRPGDVTSLIADATLVEKEWGWRPSRDLPSIFADAWRFQQMNPDGFGDDADHPRPSL